MNLKKKDEAAASGAECENKDRNNKVHIRQEHQANCKSFKYRPRGGSAQLIVQVLQLTDEQIAVLPAEQRNSIMVLKEQINQNPGR
jgi:hypothetical protein